MNHQSDAANPSRRDLLTRFRQRTAEQADAPQSATPEVPCGKSTVRLAVRAMACDFAVIMNPSESIDVETAGQSLELIAAIEDWLSPYRQGSEISRVNREAADTPVQVRGDFFELLQLCETLWQQTEGRFDPAAGALNGIWRAARKQGRIPERQEIDAAVSCSGFQHVQLDAEQRTVSFLRRGVQLDPGAIGKGYALDQAALWLREHGDPKAGFLVHGGHSSLLAAGGHAEYDGWPVGLGNPLLTEKRMATVLLKNQAMGTSGSNIQFFRHAGERMGHILDSQTGWPVKGMLSVTVFAKSAAVADALSTAFFALGIEKAVECCQRMADIAAILVPFPEQGVRLQPVVVAGHQIEIWWDDRQVQVDYNP